MLTLLLYRSALGKDNPFRALYAYNSYMTHALSDLLADKFDNEPPEMKVIKDYVQANFKESVAVTVREKQIVINTRSSALAGALRPHLYELTKLCKTKKRLSIRIG